MDPRMLDVLLISWMAFLCFAFLVCWARYRLEWLRREVDEAEALETLSDNDGSSAVSARAGAPLNKISSGRGKA